MWTLLFLSECTTFNFPQFLEIPVLGGGCYCVCFDCDGWVGVKELGGLLMVRLSVRIESWKKVRGGWKGVERNGCQ